MKILSRRILLPIVTVLCVCVPNAARAQAPLEPAQAKITPEQFQEYAGLLENSFTAGYVSAPVRRNLSNGAAVADAKAPAWNGLFFVYDRTGKEMLLAKAILVMRENAKEPPQLSQVTIGGVQVVKS